VNKSPGEIFPLNPPLPFPASDITEKQLFDFVTSIRVEDGPEEELRGYATHDFRRFVYTLGLAQGLRGRCLELGANPYFTTMLLKQFTQLELSLGNYFGPQPVSQGSQGVEFRDFISEERKSLTFTFEHFNVEEERFPYEDAAFSVVVFAEIIEHLLNDPLKVLREIRRVLKPGGQLILTTPNVNRLENVARMLSGANIYDPYSGYGPYGRHNREYNKHEMNLLLTYAGFTIQEMFTADVHANNAWHFFDLTKLRSQLKFRQADLGQYIFLRAICSGVDQGKKPSWLYRSYPTDELDA